MKVLITGANGFIGQNLSLFLAAHDIETVGFTREHSVEQLPALLGGVDFVIHLAGVNRPQDPAEFQTGNADFTESLCSALLKTNRAIPIIYSSSIQAELDNPYGLSKRQAEEVVLEYAQKAQAKAYVYRLPNVFGKWARPNYNSVVATFCHRISQGLPIEIHNPDAPLELVYIDDVMASFLETLKKNPATGYISFEPVYRTTVGELAKQIESFKESRETLVTENVGTGFVRALYATYVSYLKPEQFSYTIPQYGDERGVFSEVLKTKEAGQFSFFTAHPSVTRGSHYHHTKSEKFLVLKGKARFGFRHMITGEYYELFTDAAQPEIVETVPGWTHDITNVGDDEMIVMLWANEIFDREKPDTYAEPVTKEP